MISYSLAPRQPYNYASDGTPCGTETGIFWYNRSIPWLLIPWLFMSPGHQQLHMLLTMQDNMSTMHAWLYWYELSDNLWIAISRMSRNYRKGKLFQINLKHIFFFFLKLRKTLLAYLDNIVICDVILAQCCHFVIDSFCRCYEFICQSREVLFLEVPPQPVPGAGHVVIGTINTVQIVELSYLQHTDWARIN